MARKQLNVELTQDEHEFLTAYVARGHKKARYINRARTLLMSHEGKTDQEIATLLGISRATVYNVRNAYHHEPYHHIRDILHDKPRQGRPIKFDSEIESHLTIIACSDAPTGSARWTLHLMADKMVQLGIVDSISHESVRSLLKKNKLKPWLNKPCCMGQITGSYLWHIEDVLHQYASPYDPLRPLICFDERPCFLIDDIGSILPMSPGKVKRYHDEYAKNGSCCVLLAFEPHTGFRYVEVRDRRTAVDYAEFMKNLVTKHDSQVEQIRLVQDNLNTHTPGSFFEVLDPEEAFELGQQFDLHYTPKKG